MEPNDTYELLVESHLPNLIEDEQQLLAAVLLGWSAADIAAQVFKVRRTVRDNIQRLIDRICDPAGIHRSAASVGWWAGMHESCHYACTARAFELIRTNSIFAKADTA
jgi:hypothetical protein